MRFPAPAPIRYLLAAVFCLAVATVGTSHADATAPSSRSSTAWLRGWPMVGHDPQRTNRGPVVGPTHPHLVFSRRPFFLRLIDPHGRLYGYIVRHNVGQSVALDANGRRRIVYHASLGAQALMPNRELLAGGLDDGEIHAFGPSGRLLWMDGHVGLFKSAMPLTTVDNRFYAPFEGHPEDRTAGIDIVAASGRIIRHIEPATSVSAVALSPTGEIYAITDLTSQDDTLQALTPAGKRLWQRALGSLPYNVGGCNCPLVGLNGTVYVSGAQSLVAYRPDGIKAWSHYIAGGPLALAQRSDGVLLAAGPRFLDAISPGGKTLWRVRLTQTPAGEQGGAVIVDARGTAYVGGSDGVVRVVSQTGTVLAVLKGHGDTLGDSPELFLSPNGHLIISGADGTLQVYR